MCMGSLKFQNFILRNPPNLRQTIHYNDLASSNNRLIQNCFKKGLLWWFMQAFPIISNFKTAISLWFLNFICLVPEAGCPCFQQFSCLHEYFKIIHFWDTLGLNVIYEGMDSNSKGHNLYIIILYLYLMDIWGWNTSEKSYGQSLWSA